VTTKIRCLFSAGLLVLLAACSHPLEIIGEGDIVSASGDRDCLYEDSIAGASNCTENSVIGNYLETYYAEPRPGWEFVGWENYCNDVPGNECAFDVPANIVQQAWGLAVPPLRAVFSEAEPPIECTDSADIVCDYDISAAQWASGARLTTQVTIPAGKRLVSSFATREGLEEVARFSFALPVGEDHAVRYNTWVSETPNGAPLTSRCRILDRTFAFSLRVTTYPSFYCVLEAGQQYFLILEHVDPGQSPSALMREFLGSPD